tara:strand:- start:2163 stop:3119 length:957 start_codon:yes stop_codon:yes gene_type:complete
MPGAWNATILVGTHHKTGTVLLAKVFRVAAHLMDIPRHKNNYTACASIFATRAPGVCIDEHVSANSLRAWLHPKQPFIHAVRQPLEMCVSAYLYHLQGQEPWLLKPLPDLSGLTLQQHYLKLNPMDGVRFECRRMVTELLESAVVYNRTRSRRNVLTLRFEAFAHDFDGSVERIFTFLDSGSRTGQLLKLSQQFDLARVQPENDKHVSASDEKAPLRAHLAQDPPMARLLQSLTALLGYDGDEMRPAATADELCEQVRVLCATTHANFFQWCRSGRLVRGMIASMPECGDRPAPAAAGAAAALASQLYRTKVSLDAVW